MSPVWFSENSVCYFKKLKLAQKIFETGALFECSQKFVDRIGLRDSWNESKWPWKLCSLLCGSQVPYKVETISESQEKLSHAQKTSSGNEFSRMHKRWPVGLQPEFWIPLRHEQRRHFWLWYGSAILGWLSFEGGAPCISPNPLVRSKIRSKRRNLFWSQYSVFVCQEPLT